MRMPFVVCHVVAHRQNNHPSAPQRCSRQQRLHSINSHQSKKQMMQWHY
jgi:hypothetical protein